MSATERPELSLELVQAVLEEVALERIRQHEKFGEQNPPDGTDTAYIRDAETARAQCDDAFSKGRGTWRHILDEETKEAFAEKAPAALRKELLEVAAVAVAWVEAIDRAAKAAAQPAPAGPEVTP